jgi:CRP-like cAMP-binding protein
MLKHASLVTNHAPTMTTNRAAAALDLRSVLCSEDWFGACPPALQDALLAHGRERRLAPGEHLFARGAPDGGLYCVLGGSLVVQSADEAGEMPVLVVLEPYHWFGELSFIDGLPRSHDAMADVPSIVWCVPRAPLATWLEHHPQHWRDIARLAAGKLRVVYQVVDEEMRRPMTQRMARRLWLAAMGWGWRPHAPRQRLKLSQEVLARMLGSSRSSVSKALRELEDAGAIRLGYGTMEVQDLALLRSACGR